MQNDFSSMTGMELLVYTRLLCILIRKIPPSVESPQRHTQKRRFTSIIGRLTLRNPTDIIKSEAPSGLNIDYTVLKRRAP